MKEIYQSKKRVQKKSLSALKKDFLVFLRSHHKIFCSALGRFVFMDKQPEAILKRKDAKYRLESFSVGIDILQKSKCIIIWNPKKAYGYALKGLTMDNQIVIVHLREEKDSKKDKKCFFISTFHKQAG